MTAGTELAGNRATETDDLRAQLNALKSSLVSADISAPLPWPLSPIERSIFGMLLAQDVVSKKTIVLLLHNREANASDLKNVDVFISRIRAKTSGRGVTIETIFGVGYRIEAPIATNADLMSVYPIADQHNGLLAWGRETGESYDLSIGAERLRSCMARLVSMSPPSRHALILNLGDWTHSDDSKNMTPRGGNLLDVDGRYPKVIATGVRLMMDCIELALAKHETVTVRNLPGNHDPHASFALTIALSCFYANNPRVKIDESPSEWFFTRFGATLIGAHHGHKAKPETMAMTMAVERREDWGATAFHWFLYGHIHHETAKEVGDVRCESFQTLASRDAYHAGAGYTSGRSLTSITLHAVEGEVGRHRINIPPPMAAPLAA